MSSSTLPKIVVIVLTVFVIHYCYNRISCYLFLLFRLFVRLIVYRQIFKCGLQTLADILKILKSPAFGLKFYTSIWSCHLMGVPKFSILSSLLSKILVLFLSTVSGEFSKVVVYLDHTGNIVAYQYALRFLQKETYPAFLVLKCLL